MLKKFDCSYWGYNSVAQQDKELAVAAGKLAECQKTIASLGQQLRSLANIDDMALEIEGIQLKEGFSETRVFDGPILLNGREDAQSRH